jgi:hypothetical protein
MPVGLGGAANQDEADQGPVEHPQSFGPNLPVRPDRSSDVGRIVEDARFALRNSKLDLRLEVQQAADDEVRIRQWANANSSFAGGEWQAVASSVASSTTASTMVRVPHKTAVLEQQQDLSMLTAQTALATSRSGSGGDKT